MAAQGRNILLVVVIAASLAGGGATGFFAKGFLEDKYGSREAVAADHPTGGREKKKEVMAKLDPFMVNLADQDIRRYLRTTLQLSLHQQTDKKSLKKAAPRIRDAVLTLLSSKRIEELLTVEGKTRLRGEIAEQINAAIGKEAVAAVYFADFLIQ